MCGKMCIDHLISIMILGKTSELLYVVLEHNEFFVFVWYALLGTIDHTLLHFHHL
jgi:hypothetical protein